MIVKLGDVCSIQSGGTPSRSKLSYWENGNIPWVKVGDIDGKYLSDVEEYITNDGLQNSSAKIFKKGTILYTIFATLGEACILEIDATTNQAIAGIQIINDNVLYRDFLYYYLISLKPKVNKIGRGVAQNNINMALLKKFEILVPSLEEQRKIAETLDKVSDLIAKRKQQLEKLDLLVKSRFVEMFGDPIINPLNWPLKSLLDIGICKNGMNFHYNDFGVDIHCLGVGDFKDLSIIDDTSKLPILSLNEMPSDDYLLKDGDIVFVRSNGNKELVGRCLVVYPQNIITTFSGFCIRFRKTCKLITVSYLLQVLKSDSIRKKMVGRGANIQNLNQQILNNLSIPVPPTEMQTKFAEFVQQTEKTKTIINQSLEKLETLKKALMQEYFG